jgi:hypothetical protein
MTDKDCVPQQWSVNQIKERIISCGFIGFDFQKPEAL